MTDGSPARAETTLKLRPWTYLFPRALFPAAVIMFVVYALVTGDSGRSVIVLGLVALTQAVIPIVGFVGARRQPWSVKIGPDGVTWHNPSHHLPWFEVAQIRVSRSWWRRLLLPGVRLVDQRQEGFAARAGSRPMSALIDTRHLDMNADQVLHVIARYTDRPPIAN